MTKAVSNMQIFSCKMQLYKPLNEREREKNKKKERERETDRQTEKISLMMCVEYISKEILENIQI